MVENSGELDTRSRILEAARGLSAEKGMRAVTVRAVSEAAGVGMGTLRHHFKSQRDLFAELVAETIDDRIDDSGMLDISVPGPDRLAQAIGQLLPADYRDVSTRASWFDVYATAFAQPPSEHSKQLLEVAARRSHHHVRAWLAQLAIEGWLETTRIDEAANTLIALSSGLLLETLTPGSPVTFEDAGASLSFAARAVLRQTPSPLGTLDDEAKSRFSVPVTTLPISARDRPARAVYVSNESGVFQVYAWDRLKDARWQMTDAPHGAVMCGMSPDGSTVWSFNDVGGNETGSWQVAPFPSLPGEVPMARPVLDSEPGMPLGHAIGSARAVLSLASREGSAVWIVEDPLSTPRERRLCADQSMVMVYAMDPLEELVVIGRSEDATTLRPHIIVLRISNGTEVARIWDGSESGLEVSGFAPPAGDMRLLMTHERGGYRRPFIWDVKADERIELDLDLTGEMWARWYPDGAALLIAHTERGRIRLYRYAIATGGLEPLHTRPGWIGTGAVGTDGSVEYLWCDAAHPPQHRVLDPNGTDHAVSPSIARKAMSRPLKDAFVPLEEEPGDSLHLLYAAPDDASHSRPTVFMIHGGPYAADEDFYSPARAAWLDAGFAVVHVNYRGSTGYGRRWRDAIIGNPGRRAAADIALARAWAIEKGLAHSSRCVIEGWSWGGYLALLSAGLNPESWEACIAGAPIADYQQAYDEQSDVLRGFDRELFGGSPAEKPELYAASSPITYTTDIKCPVLILHGRNDPRTPAGQVTSFLDRLSEQGKTHEVYEFDAGHGSLDTAETIRQTETEIGFALRHLLPAYGETGSFTPNFGNQGM